ncbi:hypothetical protein GT678_19840, partial [Blautia wexlerae]|nr:hypothetical protein [Blautia wexlerae]MZS98652.1 hypothetical protein [Blautia wexlerae]MZT06141.1 hypothetical protein [Blautia wexlerae]MZT21381.1 hypothetical protein [Blautia wexlerae]MZT25167.1 hypothetical protein [Blautia wexlerae]
MRDTILTLEDQRQALLLLTAYFSFKGQSENGCPFLFVRAKPCLPLWSFSLIRKTELWKTNK